MSETPPVLPTKWDDLTVRITSAVIMTVVGAIGVILGGLWFQMMVVFVTAVMVWELWMMIRPESATSGMLLAALLASVMSGQLHDETYFALLLFLVVPSIGAFYLKKERITYFCFALGIQLAGWGLVHFRSDYGFTWILWLMTVVIATDVFGYFAGRTFGGPKFWPSVSPKKTWSGTVAGWIAAGFVGFVFTLFTNAGLTIILISMVLSFAGQMGDIAESALKRQTGIKDSSQLIPGHGGVFDRFDGMLGAGALCFLAAITWG